MANPEHIPELDDLDRFTVKLYRSGLGISALGLVVHAVGAIAGGDHGAWMVPLGRTLTLAGGALALANVHLYDKRFRWLIPSFGWLGLVVVVAAGEISGRFGEIALHAGLGFVYVGLSALALKERFCFRLPGLPWVPLFLATSLLPMVFGPPAMAGIILLPAAVIYTLLAVGKSRQPLHFDIGRKDMYQI
jgi:uncharacterized integral membrane protein